MKASTKLHDDAEHKVAYPQPNGVVYSKKKNFCPFSTPPLEEYASIIGAKRMERLQRAAEPLQGLNVLELNATAQGGGVAEMLFSSVPFMNDLGVVTEWKIIKGNQNFFECTKNLHNILQGMKGEFTPEMEQCYYSTLEDKAQADLIEDPDVVMVNDPQPLGLAHHHKKGDETWIWRCHIDIEDTPLVAHPDLWDFLSRWIKNYDAAIFSAAHYIVSLWPPVSYTHLRAHET